MVTLMANNQEVFVCGDKRITRIVQEKDGSWNAKKISDNETKVYKINENIIVGSVGNRRICNEFLKPAVKDGKINEENRTGSYGAFVEVFNTRIKECVDLITNSNMTKEECSFACIVVGVDNGKIVSTVYGYPMKGGDVSRHVFEEDEYRSTTIGIMGYDDLFHSNYDNTSGEVNDRIKEAFGKTLEIVSKENETVGTTYDIVHVSL